MSTGRPGPGFLMRSRIISIYTGADRPSLRVTAKRAGCGYESVRRVLAKAGIAIEPRVRGPAPLSALAEEIFADMQGHFHGRCTRAELREWLGESPAAIKLAIGQLRRRGLIEVWDKVYTVAAGHQMKGAA